MNKPRPKLIIGGHSCVVRALDLGESFDVISHSEISDIDFNMYADVFLFSWSYKNNEENLKLISSVPPEKPIFISSIAVFSNQYRSQWAKYPKFKSICERLVMEKNGRVLRLASMDLELIQGIEGDYAHTSPQMLKNFLLKFEWPNSVQVINLFSIHRAESYKNFLTSCLSRINRLIPNIRVLQFPFIFISKIFSSPNYGYTYDCHRYIHNEVMIGYGALGSAYDKINFERFRKIIIGIMPNTFLKNNGFKNSIIGKKGIGLAAFWHGVLTVQVPETKFVKKDVLLTIKRPFPKKSRSERLDVLSIRRDGTLWEIKSVSKNGKIVFDYANRLVLAAGPLENIRLLSGMRSINCVLDDDENSYIGFASLEECIEQKLVKKIGPLIINCYGLRLRDDFFIEARPLISSKEYQLDDGAPFYTRSNFQIFLKLIKGFSLRRINEAFFNKFGCAFSTKKLAIFCQVLSKNSISISCEKSKIESLSRERLTESSWREIQRIVSESLPSFISTYPVFSFDGLHIQGGWSKEVEEICAIHPNSSLLILGSPRQGRSNPFHTTRIMQQEIAESHYR